MPTPRVPAHEREALARLPIAGAREWVGGIVPTPFFITGGPEPWRARMALVVELDDGVVVGQRLLERDEGAERFVRVLADAMRAPAVGEPRRPERIRVGSDDIAREVRSALGDLAAVTVAPTPELEEVVDSLAEWSARRDAERTASVPVRR